MKETNQRPINTGNSAGVSTKTGKSPETNSDVKTGGKADESEDSQNDEEGCHNNNRKYEKSVFKFTIPGGEKGREPSNYQSQRAEQINLLYSFQKRRAFLLIPGDLICKVDLKDAYFAVPLAKSSQKYVRF